MTNILHEIVDVVKNGNNIDFICEIVSKGNKKIIKYNFNSKVLIYLLMFYNCVIMKIYSSKSFETFNLS